MSFGQHIKLRWWQRGERNHPRVAEAWRQGEDVGVPGRPDLNARFHEESKTVIARKTGGGGTVLNSENMILYKIKLLSVIWAFQGLRGLKTGRW